LKYDFPVVKYALGVIVAASIFNLGLHPNSTRDSKKQKKNHDKPIPLGPNGNPKARFQ